MEERDEPGPLETLILVRLLPAGEKGVKPAEIRKDLEPLLSHRWSGTTLSAMLDRSLIRLVSRNLAVHLPVKSKKAVPPLSLTDRGRETALSFLRVSQLPARPKLSWANLKKALLLGPALGLSGPSAALAKDDSLRALLLKRQYTLPTAELPTLKQARDEWLRKHLGMGEKEKVTLDSIQSALFRRELGEDQPLPVKKALDRLLAKKLNARRDDAKELRDAVLRSWIDRSLDGNSPDPGPTLAPPLPPPAAGPDSGADSALELPDFARHVLTAARTASTGRYGDNKVFIVHVWKSLRDHEGFRGMDLAAFKRRLAEANNARLLDLSRADLVQAMDPEDVRLSEVSYLNAAFHFIRVEAQERLSQS